MLPSAELERTENGLRLVLAPDEHAESVSFGVFVASGSRHEPAALRGVSHFIEHMLFKGTARRSPLAISRAIEGCGGSFNAFTSEESTCFYARLPAEGLETAVDVLSDMYLHAAVPLAEFERERRVILEEIKMYEDEPDSVAAENLSRGLFPGNALGEPIAGGAATLAKMTPATLRTYLKRAYVPATTVAAVVGRFDPDRARCLVARAFGGLARGRSLAARRVDPRACVLPEIRASRDVQQVQLALGYRTFGLFDERRYAASVFDALMGRAMSSRLFQSVRERRGLSYDVHSNLQLFEECGGWTVTAGLDAARADKALAAIDAELDRIRQKKPGAAELRRTKDFLRGNFRLGFERAQTRLFYFGGGALTYGRIVPPQEVVDRIEDVTADDVLDVAQALLRDDRRCASWVVPKTP